MAPPITKIRARQVYNSRGEPTVEVEVWVDGARGVAAAPSGASVGRHEASSLPQGGIGRALQVVGEAARRLQGLDASDPNRLTQELKRLDPSPGLIHMGAAVAYAITVAAAKAYAAQQGKPLYQYLSPGGGYTLPLPVGNIVGGGRHALSPRMDLQELLVIPVGAKSMGQAVEAMVMVHRRMGALLARHDQAFTGGRGDEGAWTSSLPDVELLRLLSRAVEEVEAELGVRLRLGVDMASTTLWDAEGRVYRYRREGAVRDEEEQLRHVVKLMEDFGLYYIEDPFHEDSFDQFARLTSLWGSRLVCGDDLVATSLGRLRRAVEARACNAVILKVNQVGFLSEALAYAVEAASRGMVVVASHRSGESTDETLAHIAIAARSKLIKTGVIGGERVAKLNELIRIEEEGIPLARAGLP